MLNYKFYKKEHLRENFLINRLFKIKNKIVGNFFIIYFLKNNLDFNRIAISVSKKLGNSVERNYYRRIIREIYRKNKHLLNNNYDFLIILKNKPNNYKEATDEIISFFEKL